MPLGENIPDLTDEEAILRAAEAIKKRKEKEWADEYNKRSRERYDRARATLAAKLGIVARRELTDDDVSDIIMAVEEYNDKAW